LYEDQVEIFKNEQLNREPLKLPKLKINPDIKTLEINKPRKGAKSVNTIKEWEKPR